MKNTEKRQRKKELSLRDEKTGLALLSAGQFARLCGVSKDTVLYYDRIGLLKPFLIQENGYRYYTTMELNQFHSITTLQDSGLTLTEIREFLNKEDADTLIPLFERMEKTLRQKQHRYERLAAQVSHTLASMREAVSCSFFTPEIEEKPQEFLAVMSTSDDRISDAVRTNLVSEYYRYCMNNEKRADFFRGGIIRKEHIEEPIRLGNYLDYLCIRVDNRLYAESFDQSQLFEKPAGTYAVVRCPGGLEKTLEGIRCLQDFIRDTERTIVGCGYEFEILGTFTAESEHTCIKRIEIQIT